MKKFRLLLTAVSMAGILLAGCNASQKSVFNPSTSCIYVARDGSLSSALVREYEGEAVDAKDLKQYLEAAVIRFNQANGAEGIAANKPGADKLPAALQSVKAEKSVLKAAFEYASLEDLVKFRQTGDNEDLSNTITALEVKKTGEAAAAGWFEGAELVKADGSAAAKEDAQKDAESTAVSIEGGGNVMFAGSVLYMTKGTVRIDSNTVTVPEGGKALVVFK